MLAKWSLNSFDSSNGLVTVNPFTFSDATDVFPDFREVRSFMVCQVFQESLVCLLKLFLRKVLPPYPTTARGLIFEFNMAEARLDLAGST